MLKSIAKGAAVVFASLMLSTLFGIIITGRQLGTLLPHGSPAAVNVGIILTVFGLLIALVNSILIIKYFVFFTHTTVLDRDGNTISDNKSVGVGSLNIHPLLASAIAAVLSVVAIGLGMGMIFDNLEMYIIYLLSIAFILIIVAFVFFLFSVVGHKIRRRFAWIASGVLGLLALIVISSAIPAIKDLSVSGDEVTAVTATVISTSAYNGFMSGPGKSVIVIKGTSGETITLKYSGSHTELIKGQRYTFYYLPNTHLIEKVNEADKIQY